jgi:hypothetical protein
VLQSAAARKLKRMEERMVQIAGGSIIHSKELDKSGASFVVSSMTDYFLQSRTSFWWAKMIFWVVKATHQSFNIPFLLGKYHYQLKSRSAVRVNPHRRRTSL